MRLGGWNNYENTKVFFMCAILLSHSKSGNVIICFSKLQIKQINIDLWNILKLGQISLSAFQIHLLNKKAWHFPCKNFKIKILIQINRNNL